jgi:hypothetical protein
MEKRSASRLQTRLRPGKLLTEEGRFIGDCAITDRTERGARVRIFEPQVLPQDLTLFDERDTLRWGVHIAWIKGAHVGLRFTTPAAAVDDNDVERIAGRYYAIAP